MKSKTSGLALRLSNYVTSLAEMKRMVLISQGLCKNQGTQSSVCTEQSMRPRTQSQQNAGMRESAGLALSRTQMM